jgi:hypothetical protein
MATSPHSDFPRVRRPRATGSSASEFAFSVRIARFERLARHDRYVEPSLRTLRRALGLEEAV